MSDPFGDLVESVLAAIRSVTGAGQVALHEPCFAGNEWAYVKECLDSTYVSSVGKFVDRFEADLAQYTGARHAVAVVNGTAALQVALRLAGVEAEDEVLVPALSFVATANAVAYCGAVPHFIDCEEVSLGLDPVRLREYLDAIADRRSGRTVNIATGRVIRALVPMHVFGHPSDLDELLAVAHDFNLAMVEDAAESLGSFYHGRHTGTFGLMGTLSFNGNKTITTGGGGAILTDDAELARAAKHLTTTAKLPHRWQFEHDQIGYNYRLPNINAALGCAQLEQLEQFVSGQRLLFERYQDALESLDAGVIMREPEGCRSNYWLQTLILQTGAAARRDAILQACNDTGLMVRPAWMLLNRLVPYRNSPAMALPVASALSERIVNLPSSPRLVGAPA